MVVENMLDDLFKTVTKRFYGEEGAHAHEQPTFKCPRCQHTVLLTVFQEAGKVCPNCRYHARLTAKERLQITADANSFVEYDAELESLDPLSFPNYAEKVAQLQEKTGLKDAVLTGECTIQGSRAVIIIMDSHFMMASMGSAVGEKITRAFERAAEKATPCHCLHRFRWCKNAGRHSIPDADGKDLCCCSAAQRSRTVVYYGHD